MRYHSLYCASLAQIRWNLNEPSRRFRMMLVFIVKFFIAISRAVGSSALLSIQKDIDVVSLNSAVRHP